jgi:hypothetical protein
MSNSIASKVVKSFTAFGAVAFLVTGAIFLFNSGAILSAVSDPTVLAAQYVAGRNFAVGLLILATLIKGEYRPLAWLLLLVAGFEAFDAVVGLWRGVPSLIVPSLVLALAFAASARFMLKATQPTRP